MKKMIFAALLSVALCSPGFAQLRVQVSEATTMQSSFLTVRTELIDSDGKVLDSLEEQKQPTLPTASKQTMVTVTSDAKNISVYADDINRDPVVLVQVAKNKWLVPPGKCWVDVRAIDFDKNIYETTKIVVVGVGGRPSEPVANDYGVGQVSADTAPADKRTRAQVAEHHRQAGEFLYGRPSLKSVTNENYDDPGSNVFAWLNQQAAEMECPDPETCKQWATWRQKVGEAFQVSQETREYTRADWYKAFNEIAESLK